MGNKNNKVLIYIIFAVAVVIALVFYIYLSFFAYKGTATPASVQTAVSINPGQVTLSPEDVARKVVIISSFENQSPEQMNQAQISRKLAILKAIQAQ